MGGSRSAYMGLVRVGENTVDSKKTVYELNRMKKMRKWKTGTEFLHHDGSSDMFNYDEELEIVLVGPLEVERLLTVNVRRLLQGNTLSRIKSKYAEALDSAFRQNEQIKPYVIKATREIDRELTVELITA